MAESDFGRLVKDGRERLGLTQVEFAGKVGVSSNTVSAWETGRFNPEKAKNLDKLAEVLGVNLDTLLGRRPARSETEEAYRLGLVAAAKRIRELAKDLEKGGTVVDARSLKAGQNSRKRVGLTRVEKVGKQIDRSLKTPRSGKSDRLSHE